MGTEGTVGITVNVPVEVHEKLVKLAKSRKVSLKELTRTLLFWAGDTDVEDIIGAGVSLPIWPEDSFSPTPSRKNYQNNRNKAHRW